jgi:hypothetical protein
MRALLISTDLVMKSDGTYTPTEINTATGNHLKIVNLDVDSPTYFTDNFAEYINHIEFDLFLQSNNITKIKIIDKVYGFSQIFEGFCKYYTNYEYELIKTRPDSITVPFVEDDDDTIIIRVAYDTTALVDDLYARDMFEFHNLIKDETFASPVTFNTGDETNIDSITFEPSIDGVVPNYVVKKRTPGVNYRLYPNVYRLDNQSQLDTLKESLTSDEFIQKFEYNGDNLVNNRVSFIRSVDILYGSDLNVFNLLTTKNVNSVSTQNNTFIYETETDENGKLNILFASKYYPKIIHKLAESFHFDATDKIVVSDNSVMLTTNLSVGDTVKIAQFNVENKKNITVNVENLDVFTFTSASVNAIGEKSGDNVFINLTAVDENNNIYEWYDGLTNYYLIQNPVEDVIQYTNSPSGKIQIGDKIYVYDSVLNQMKPLTITNITFEVKDITTYSITLEENKREFLIELSENLFLLQHNSSTCDQNCSNTGCGGDIYGTICSGCQKGNNCPECGGFVSAICFAVFD